MYKLYIAKHGMVSIFVYSLFITLCCICCSGFYIVLSIFFAGKSSRNAHLHNKQLSTFIFKYMHVMWWLHYISKRVSCITLFFIQLNNLHRDQSNGFLPYNFPFSLNCKESTLFTTWLHGMYIFMYPSQRCAIYIYTFWRNPFSTKKMEIFLLELYVYRWHFPFRVYTLPRLKSEYL